MELKIVSWNVCSLRTHKRLTEIELLIDIERPDIILIQETNLKPTDPNPVLKGYTIHRKDRINKLRGGVAVIVKDNISHNPKHHNQYRGLTETAEIKINTENQPITIGSIYMPPEKTTLQDMKKITEQKGLFIYCGDMNAHSPRWGGKTTNKHGRILNTITQEAEIKLLIPNDHTRLGKRARPATLDMGITNIRNNIALEVIHIGTSDHNPVTFKIQDIESISKLPKPVLVATDYRKLEQELGKINWTNQEKELERKVQEFTSKIQSAILNASNTIKINEHSLPKAIKTEIINAKKLKKRAQYTNSLSDKRIANRAHKLARQTYWKWKIENTKSEIGNLKDPSKRWNAFKKLTKPKEQIPELQYMNRRLAEAKEKAETIGTILETKFRSNNFSDTKQPVTLGTRETKITETQTPGIQELMVYLKSAPNFPSPGIEAKTVEDIIRDLKPGKAAGPDGIKPRTIKLLPVEAINTLTEIINSILQTQTFPKAWKLSKIIPIRKPNKDPTNPSSYRPISLLNVLAKVAEKVIQDMTQEHIEEKGVTPNHQFGFRKEHSTTLQLTRIMGEITKSINQKRYLAMVTLDVEAAFDKIPHNKLIYKIIKTDTPLWIPKLIQDYLDNREFYVEVEGEQSKKYKQNAGTPQGGHLSPLLFSWYTADIPITPKAKLATFADDTAILAGGRTPTQAIVRMNKALENHRKWCNDNELTINPNKSTSVIFYRGKKIHTQHKIKFNNREIPRRSTIKYLGLTFDEKVTWGPHTVTIKKEAERKSGQLKAILKRNRNLKEDVWEYFYKTLIRPKLTYGLPAWVHASNTQWKTILATEKKFLRTAHNLSSTYCSKELYQKSYITPMQILISQIQEDLKEKVKKHKNPLVRKLLKQLDKEPRIMKHPLYKKEIPVYCKHCNEEYDKNG